jgi:NAD(P)-dependent dehydrogenase (short-subunit alcohol dehydrogenase family)
LPVTGAAAGIGLVTARAFAQAGAAVVLADLDEQAVCVAAAALVSAGYQALGIRCNVEEEADAAARPRRATAATAPAEQGNPEGATS